MHALAGPLYLYVLLDACPLHTHGLLPCTDAHSARCFLYMRRLRTVCCSHDVAWRRQAPLQIPLQKSLDRHLDDLGCQWGG